MRGVLGSGLSLSSTLEPLPSPSWGTCSPLGAVTLCRMHEGAKISQVNQARSWLEDLEAPLSVRSLNGLTFPSCQKTQETVPRIQTTLVGPPASRRLGLREQTLAGEGGHLEAACLRPQWTDCGGDMADTWPFKKPS